MATLLQMRTAVGLELGLDYTSGGAEQTLIDRRINEGVTDVVLRTGCKVISETITESAGTNDYTLATDILDVKSWQFNGSAIGWVPERVSIEEILRLRTSTVTTQSSYPSMFYAIGGSNLLMVWPTPAGADTITAYVVPRPATLTADADTPSEVPTEFHPAVELYALWKMGSYSDDESSGQGERYRIAYEGQDGKAGMVARIRGHVFRKGGRAGKARLGGRRKVPYPNDVYTPWG